MEGEYFQSSSVMSQCHVGGCQSWAGTVETMAITIPDIVAARVSPCLLTLKSVPVPYSGWTYIRKGIWEMYFPTMQNRAWEAWGKDLRAIRFQSTS